jgi:hypothetical protein
MLQRVHEQHQQQQSTCSLSFPNETHTAPTTKFDQEELIRMLQALETEDDAQILALLQDPHVKKALYHAIESGDLQDWILDPWVPWWRSHLSCTSPDEHDDDDTAVDPNVTESHDTTTTTTTTDMSTILDERMLRVPSFAVLTKDRKSTVDLSYNLVDLLYSIVTTLRLYHGVANAQDSAMDAAASLISASRVLHADARYTHLAEVLTACTQTLTSSSAYCPPAAAAPWHVCMEDVSLILRNKRLVARCLLEGMDILQTAIAIAKQQSAFESTTTTRVASLRAYKKKVEYYLSWALEHVAVWQKLSDEVLCWKTDWSSIQEAPNTVALERDLRIP